MAVQLSVFWKAGVILATIALQACKHPLVIVGEGDIIDANDSGRGCTLEQFQAQDTACTENEVSGDYFVNYKAQPRQGWRFVRWDGPCSPQSDFQHCLLDISADVVDWWGQTHPDEEVPSSTAVFERITGKTGYLVDSATAGVAYETPTQKGVTGLDGSFQYAEGETVRFTIGNTVLGEVTGQERLTPFDLAGSAVITGTLDITKALDNEQSPFNTVINIASLLQSLDEDGNPRNGIVIRQGVTALFRQVNLDMSQGWQTFQDEPALNHAVAQANAKLRFSKRHGIIVPALALQHLYGALGVDARTSAVTLQEDYDDGGATPSRIETWQYDANGNPTRHTTDPEGDGTQEEVVSWTYNARGYQIREEWNQVGQESLERLEYDANGNLIRREQAAFYEGDDSPVSIETWQYDANDNPIRYVEDAWFNEDDFITTWQYDSDGNLIREAEDTDGDGSPEHIRSYQYDAYGNVIREADDDGVGMPDVSTWQYQYDPDGRPTEGEFDRDNDGNTDRIDSYEYDAKGNLTLRGYDLNVDGTVDLYETWQYDADGNLIRYTEERGPLRKLRFSESWEYDASGNLTLHHQDDDGDGLPEETERWEYDANDSPTRYERDDDGNGRPDEIRNYQYRYEYDADGRLTRRERDDDGDGTPNETIDYDYYNSGVLSLEETWTREVDRLSQQWRYDASGKLRRELTDEGADGTVDSVVSYHHRANGNLARLIEDQNGDGAPDYIESYRYDTRGQVNRRERDYDADGVPEETDSWAYQNDPDGRLTQREWDQYDDGTIDAIERWAYDAYGNTTRYELTCHGSDENLIYCYLSNDFDFTFFPGLWDFPPPGSIVVNYEYDTDNRLIRESSESDGTTDRNLTYRYDTSGNLIRQESDWNGDGTTDLTESWQYDSHGNPTLYESVYDSDGIVEEITRWTNQYDANGNLVREEADVGDDGTVDRIQIWEYDAGGRLIRRERTDDVTGDDILETVETRRYEPTGWGAFFTSQ